MLLVLSLLWGGSYIFISVAVKELPALLIVFVRVILAVAILIPIHLFVLGKLPGDKRTWIAAGGMSIINNVIPFSLIVFGQHYVSASLASVINATTPLFGAVAMAAAGAEALTGQRITGLLLGLAGVMVLRGPDIASFNTDSLGVLSLLLASASYGVSGLWAKRKLAGIPPITIATCQLLISSLVMAVLASTFSQPELLLGVSSNTWLALVGLAFLSTSIAYLLFFKIIEAAGASVVLLVTMLIPVSAIAMGTLFLGDKLTGLQLLGASIIGVGLLVIDGRVLKLLGVRA